MSAIFNDTTNLKGLVQFYEKEVGANQGDVSGNATKLKEFAAGVNQALDDFFALALPASGTWQLDDSNQTDYPIITANLVANQRDYSFTVDGSSNLILEIYKVFIANASGVYSEIFPVDVQSEENTSSFTDGKNTTGTPTRYDKTSNGIFLDPIPSASITNGLKVYINREASYFTSSDTTKKPGVPGILHKYFYLKPALDYARRNNLANLPRIEAEVLKMEGNNRAGIIGSIEEYFSLRSRDEKHRLIAGAQDNR